MAGVLKAEGEGWLTEAVSHIKGNKLIVFPTETVYGVGVNLRSAGNLLKLQAAKGREKDKPITLMAGSLEIARKYFQFDEVSLKVARKFFPGPLTLVLKRGEMIPAWFFPGRQKIGLRIPGDDTALKLLKEFGEPLAVTSANTSGSPPATNFKMALFYFAHEDDLLIIDGGESNGHPPSTVVEITEGKAVILRQGPIAREEIESEING